MLFKGLSTLIVLKDLRYLADTVVIASISLNFVKSTHIIKRLLPTKHDKKVNKVPTIPQVGMPTHYKPLGNYLKYCLRCVDGCKDLIDVFDNQITLSD